MTECFLRQKLKAALSLPVRTLSRAGPSRAFAGKLGPQELCESLVLCQLSPWSHSYSIHTLTQWGKEPW